MGALAVRKFTIRDVRDGGYELREQAIRYAWNYTGDFEPIVDFQRMLNAGRMRELNEFHIKIILNTMLQDPRAPNIPATRAVPERPRLRVVERTRYPFNVVKRWNRDYLISTWRPTLTCHLLDKEKSEIEWVPSQQKYWCKARAICPINLARGYMLTLHQPLQGQHICRQCMLIQGKRMDGSI